MLTNAEIEFLEESNAIEGVYSEEALADAKLAWEYIKDLEEIGLYTVLQVHRILMRRLNSRIAGKLRTCDVFIGGERKRFEGEVLLKYKILKVCDVTCASVEMANDISEKTKEDVSRACHIMFEDIHPFEDGNGRTGRILWNWQRMKLGLPIKVIHTGEEQMEYYNWFRKKVINSL